MDQLDSIEKSLVKRISQKQGISEHTISAMVYTYQKLTEAMKAGGKLYICGNGGSHSDSMHIVGELVKNFESHRRIPEYLQNSLSSQGEEGRTLANAINGGLPSYALGTNSALTSAIANDQGQEFVFAQELAALGQKGDILLGLSTSGTSLNVVYAIRIAKALNMLTLAWTGEGESPLSSLADISVKASCSGSGSVQEVHSVLYHALCAALESRFFT